MRYRRPSTEMLLRGIFTCLRNDLEAPGAAPPSFLSRFLRYLRGGLPILRGHQSLTAKINFKNHRRVRLLQCRLTAATWDQKGPQHHVLPRTPRALTEFRGVLFRFPTLSNVSYYWTDPKKKTPQRANVLLLPSLCSKGEVCAFIPPKSASLKRDTDFHQAKTRPRSMTVPETPSTRSLTWHPQNHITWRREILSEKC